MSQNNKIPISDRWSNLETKVSFSSEFDLTQGNPTKVFQYNNVISKYLSTYNPDPKGNKKVRKKISNYYFKKKYNIYPDDIFLTTGTSESISYIIKTLCNPKDEILLPSPGYPLFELILEQENIKYNYYEYLETRTDNIIKWNLDFTSLKSKINERTKAIILVNPNNPLGIILSENEKIEFENIIKNNNIFLIVDEVFINYSIHKKNRNRNIENIFDVNYFLLNGISKSWGLPGLKLGWIIPIGDNEFLNKVKPILEIISDTYLSVSTPSQILFLQVLKKKNLIFKKILNRIRKNYKYIIRLLRSSNYLYPIQIEYGWYLPIKIDLGISEDALLNNLMQELSIKVYPGNLFHFKDKKYLIISLLVRPQILKKVMIKINKYFTEYENH
jgi:alanine-synthesizing transaminase